MLCFKHFGYATYCLPDTNNYLYYCPLNNYILHNIKRFMLDKPCFYQEFENERRLAHYGELMRKREICYLRSIRKA